MEMMVGRDQEGQDGRTHKTSDLRLFLTSRKTCA